MPDSNTKNTLIIFLSLILAVVVGATVYLSRSGLSTNPTLLSVVGEGKVKAPPELARFTVSYGVTSPTSPGALDAEKQMRQKIIKLLSDLYGVSANDIQISYPQIIPVASASGTTYQAINILDVSFRRIPSVDDAVAKLYQTGTVRVSNVVLTTSNGRDLEDKAINQAMKDATTRAERMAKAANKRLGKLVSISGEQTKEVGTVTREAIIQKGTDTPDATSGTIEIVRNVSLVYELK